MGDWRAVDRIAGKYRASAAGLLAAIIVAAAPASASAAIDFSGRTLPGNVEQDRVSVGGIETRLLAAAPEGAGGGDGPRSLSARPRELRGSREAAVFIHGFPGSSLDFVDLLSTTGRFGRAVAFDVPGFGGAEKPAGFPYTVDAEAQFIQRALKRLGIRRAHLVLHDFGGIYGLDWAAAHPRRFRSATLIDTGVLLGYLGHPIAAINATPGVGEAFNASQQEPQFRASLNPPNNPTPLPDAFLARMYDEYDNPGTRAAVPKLYRSSTNIEERAQRQKAALRPLDRRALVIWGEDDPFIPVNVAYRQREAFPRASINVFPDIGHFPFVDASDRTRSLVKPFLRRRLR